MRKYERETQCLEHNQAPIKASFTYCNTQSQSCSLKHSRTKEKASFCSGSKHSLLTARPRLLHYFTALSSLRGQHVSYKENTAQRTVFSFKIVISFLFLSPGAPTRSHSEDSPRPRSLPFLISLSPKYTYIYIYICMCYKNNG